MYKKSLTVFAAAVVLSLGATATEASFWSSTSDAISDLEYSADLGMTYSNTKLDKSGYDTTSKAGFRAGVNATYQVSDTVSLSTGASFAQRNSDREFSGSVTEQRFSYLEVPVTAAYALPFTAGNFNFAAEGGAYVGYLLTAEADDTDIKDEVSDSDYGIRLGASASTESPLAQFQSVKISATYDIGLKELDTDTKTSGLNVSVSALF